MEFLRTPDPAASAAAAGKAATPGTCGAAVTPAAAAGAGGAAGLDRAGIKSSFQTLFTPTVGGALPTATAAPPAFYTPMPAGSGLTPFLSGPPGTTPNLVTPAVGMMPFATPLKPNDAPGAARTPDMLLSSPYLQMAAKEAVRREFMNMPSYIAGVGAVPIAAAVASPANLQQSRLVYTKDGRPVSPTAGVAATSSLVTTPTENETEARVPGSDSSMSSEKPGSGADSPGARKVPQPANPSGIAPKGAQEKPGAPAASAGGPTASAPFAGNAPFFAPPHGMMLMPQMVAGPPANTVFVHPGTGMMMYAPPGAGGPHLVPAGPPGMMMHMAAPAAQMAPARMPNKAETADERKERIEREKQDLIREFKKKTREAALVRFRQKRRERRFGKLIRYECRKQLADARPRVKGRFVRIRNDQPGAATEDSESAQVVPNMN